MLHACSDLGEPETSTPEKKTQNTDIPESKASFVAYKVKNENLVLSNELIKVELPPWKI